jgi:hypothetical protein
MIVAAVREHGTKWSTIQKLLPGRSDNSIKNRYYSAIRKAQRLGRRAVSAGLTVTECEATQTESSQPSPAGSSPAKSTTGATTVGADVAAAGIDMRHAHPSDASWEASKTPQSAQGSPLGGKRKQRVRKSSLCPSLQPHERPCALPCLRCSLTRRSLSLSPLSLSSLSLSSLSLSLSLSPSLQCSPAPLGHARRRASRVASMVQAHCSRPSWRKPLSALIRTRSSLSPPRAWYKSRSREAWRLRSASSRRRRHSTSHSPLCSLPCRRPSSPSYIQLLSRLCSHVWRWNACLPLSRRWQRAPLRLPRSLSEAAGGPR